MGTKISFTEMDDIATEIIQYCYAKYGCIPAKAIGKIVLTYMVKNPLTASQWVRLEGKYWDSSKMALRPLSASAKGDIKECSE
jgi:hypothetical protein